MRQVAFLGEPGPSPREPHFIAGGRFSPGWSPVGTLMRHALLEPAPVRPLSPRVVAAPPRAPLVPTPGLAHRLAAPGRGARLRAVDVAVVAGRTDPHLPAAAAGADEDAVAVPDFGLPRRRAGRNRLPGPDWPRVSTNMLLRMCGDPDGGPGRHCLGLHFFQRSPGSTARTPLAKQAHRTMPQARRPHAALGGQRSFRLRLQLRWPPTPHERLPELSQIHACFGSH